MSLLEPSNSTTADPEHSNIAEAQIKDLETAWMNMIELLKEENNKSRKEIQENAKKKKSGRKQIILFKTYERKYKQ